MTSIYHKVIAFVNSSDPKAFEQLALEVFEFQFSYVPSYAAYCSNIGRTPKTVRSLAEIPPVSTVAFKYARTESQGAEPSPASRLFLTSGTSIGKGERGRHLVLHPEVYRASALTHLRRMLFPDGRRTAMLSL